MRRRVVCSVLACAIGGLGGGVALAAGTSSSIPPEMTVLTQTTYVSATPADPQGMPSQAASTEAVQAASQRPADQTSSPGAIVLTQTTYPNATPEDPQGMPSEAAVNQAESAAQAAGS
jgi:hypothetical protein